MSKTILLADDSLTIQKVVELTFMEEDYEVVAVSGGDEALAKLSEVEPVLVIADIHMPGASGYEICREVKQSKPGVPVLLLVGTFESLDESEVVACGANGYLKKPFDSQELLRRAELLVAEAAGEEPVAESDEDVDDIEGLATVPEPDTTMMMEAEESPPKALADEDTEIEPIVEPTPEPPLEPSDDSALSSTGPPSSISDEDVDRIARRVVELLADKTVREVSWDVIPDLAEIVIKDRLRELESQID